MNMNFARVAGHVAARFADKECLVNIERGRRYTFRELHALTNRIVNMMRGRLGLRRGDRYLCILENDNLSMLHAWTALKGEATAVWTNIRDAAAEHRWQIDFIRPKAVFLENALVEELYPTLRELDVAIVCMDPLKAPRAGVRYFWDLLEGVGEGDPGIESDIYADHLIFRFTGGTTGKSKCAQYTIDNWLGCRDSSYAHTHQDFAEDTRAAHFAPISHGSGITILPTFFRGGCTITLNLPDLKLWCRTVETEKVTTSLMLPVLMYRLLDMPETAQYDLSSFRTCAYGGAPISPAKLAQLRARFGDIFIQGYGATECLQTVTLLNKMDHAAGDERRLASAGAINPGAEVLIVDEAGKPLPAGEIGEIWVRGRAVISGYYNNPEGTAAEFADGFWKSGDLGYLDDQHYLFLVDRKKDMIITGGFNVYAIEVENALNAHPAVSLSAVVGVPHEEWGEAVHAEVVLRANARVSGEALIEHAKERIGRFKAPKSIAFVEAVPVSVVGKVLRRQVREKYWKDQARRVG